MTTVDISWKLRAQKAETDAKRYRWLREHIEFINFEGLTTDTCDVGLDHAIDSHIRRATFDGFY